MAVHKMCCLLVNSGRAACSSGDRTTNVQPFWSLPILLDTHLPTSPPGPVQLVDEVEKRHRLKILTPFLEHLINEGSTDPHVHNALGEARGGCGAGGGGGR